MTPFTQGFCSNHLQSFEHDCIVVRDNEQQPKLLTVSKYARNIYYNSVVYLQSNCSQTSWSSGKKHRAPQPPSQTPENTNQESQFRNLKDKSLKKWKNDDSLRKKCYLTTGLSLLLLSIAILFVILLKRFVLGSDQNQISKYFLLSLLFFNIFFNKSQYFQKLLSKCEGFE